MLAAGALVLTLAACSDDGRTLRPAEPGQDETISAPATTPTSDGIVAAPSTASSPSTTSSADPARFVSAPWPAGGAIDTKYTCDGADVSPAFQWGAAPAGTAEIALSVIDEDAEYVHWVIAGLDATSTGLDEGSVPLTASQAINSAGHAGWDGPCGQVGTTHTYTVTVWYLGQQTELGDASSADDLLAVVRGSALSSAETTGTYSRS